MSKQDQGPQESGSPNRYYGKYRGTVLDNVDPESRGRILAIVPRVYGALPSSWALPCLPGIGLQAGPAGPSAGLYAVPKIGSWVWMEFEEGDPQRPIWSGGFWPGGLLDPITHTPLSVTKTVLQTQTFHSLTLDDVAGITLQLTSGQKVQLTPLGVVLEALPGVSVALTEAGITLQAAGASLRIDATGISLVTPAGLISLSGTTINMNQGALVVIK